MNHYQKELCKIIRSFGYEYDISQIFSDFVECAAIAISNRIDILQRERREKRYIEIMKRYKKLENQQKFCEMFACLVNALEYSVKFGNGPDDILGNLFHELELHNKFKGQFFTPQNVSDMIGKMTAGEYDKMIRENGYIKVMEPCCGSGVMVFSFAKAFKEQKYNYNTQMLVKAIDVDIKCVHMAYTQMSLYGIPGVVIHGNTLLQEEWSYWYTPVYLIDNWRWRECRKYDSEDRIIKKENEDIYTIDKSTETRINDIMPLENTIDADPSFAYDIKINEEKGGQLEFNF